MCAWFLVVMEFCGVCAVGGVAACGSGSNRSIDAMPDAGPPPCVYTEKADATNDPAGDPASDPKAEPTGLTIGTMPQILCGTINAGHFNSATMTVDADAYRVASDGTNVVVRFSGSSGAPAMARFSVFVFDFDENMDPRLLFGGSNSPSVRDHGAFLIALPAGTYEVVVSAQGSADLAASFDYRVEIAPDGPTRCPAVTAPAAYTEAADGAGASNDVVAFDFDFDPSLQLTTSTTDVPEPTGLTIDASTPIRITGSSANGDAEDDYMDRDTYLIRTGATTNELTLRLDWADAHADLNYLVFPADQTEKVGDSLRFDSHEEYNVIAVNPDSSYWIWVGSHDDSTGLPAAYDLTICGTSLIR